MAAMKLSLKWLESTIIPISKSGKDPTNPSNYRPIAITSVLCKSMERKVNVTLLDFFYQKGTLSTLQCGYRAKRTTIYHILCLEVTVRKAEANSEQVVSIFFDMEKAYDLTWRHGILMDLIEAEIKKKNFQFHTTLSQTHILQSQTQRNFI